MKPIKLLSDFLGGITFPHYTKFKDKDNQMTAGVVYDSENPLNIGDHVVFLDLQKNLRVFSVKEIKDIRLARGDWSFRGKKKTMFCSITTSLVGFWNPIREHEDGGVVSPEYITDKKEAA